MNTLIGEKVTQSQVFTEAGARIPVTTMVAGPCWVTGTVDHGEYRNIQLSFGTTKKITKALQGHMKKAGLEDKKPRFFREIRVPTEGEQAQVALGKELTVGELFAPGDKVQVTGTSKGKGFAGVVKRHGFRGGPRTHGQSDRERAPGSIGQTTTPGRVYKGKRMAGRMGNERVTVRGLVVVSVNPEKNELTVKGLVPGAKHSMLIIQKEV